MQTVLVFAPCANPTYMPLGIASLAEDLSSHGYKVRALDLNIKLWNIISHRQDSFNSCRDFMKGKNGNFFDKSQYIHHLNAWKEMAAIIAQYCDDAAEYLQNDSLSESLAEILSDFSSEILADEPEICGISIMYPAQVVPSLALAKYIRSLVAQTMPKIILGGATIATLDSAELLEACDFIGAILSGEGEIGLRRICENEDLGTIKGLSYRKNGKIIKNNKPETLSPSQIKLPMFNDFDLQAYFNPSPVVPVIFSRGCKWRKCRFCAHNFSYSGYRKHNITTFVDYLAKLKDTIGAESFYFGDQYVDACDMAILSEEIISRKLNIAFHFMGRPTDDYSPEILQTISDAGCRWISWGVETGSQRLLDVSNKGTQVNTVKQIIIDAAEAKISNLPMMIYGLPTSSDFDLELTLDFLDDIADLCGDITSSSFQLFSNTPFAVQAEKFDLKIIGKELIITINGSQIHSSRLLFKELAQDKTLRSPRGAIEVARWTRRKQMMGIDWLYSNLCCEHYLLYANFNHNAPANKPLKAANF